MDTTPRIHLLGGFHLANDAGDAPDLGQARLQLLLGYLLVHRESPQSRRQLAFLFWPETSEKQAHTNLRKLIYMLRKALPDAEKCLTITAKTVQWRSDAPLVFDVVEFEQAIDKAAAAEHAGDAAGAEEWLQQAVGLYRGEFLSDFYEDWILAERDRLHRLCIEALARLSRLCESRRDYDAAIGHVRTVLHHDPLHETNYRRLMRLYASNGDRAGALRIYHDCVAVLARELDVQPSRKTVEIYQRLLAADADLTPEFSLGPSVAEEAPLVGRKDEWRILTEAWRLACGGRVQVVLISGEAGIGKTRLATQLSQNAARQGYAVAAAAPAGVDVPLAFGPIVAWLRSEPIRAALSNVDDVWLAEVSRLLPELYETHPHLPNLGSLDEGWQKQRLYEALARIFLSSGKPLLLHVEDLQWCDAETLAWLHFLVRCQANARLMIVGTLRSDELNSELGGNRALAHWRTLLANGEMLTEIELGSLDAAETSELAAHLHRRRLTPDEAARFYVETEGHPLFVVEMARARGVGTVSTVDCTSTQSQLPGRIRAVLETRLEALSPATREVASLAAVVGRDFTYPVLANAAELDEEKLVSCLDELWRRRIIREQGVDAYDFRYEKLRDLLYTGLSSVHRRLLHRRVAYALRRLHVDARQEMRAEIAGHLERAGLASEARAYVRRADRRTTSERTMPTTVAPAHGVWLSAPAI